MYIKVEGKFIRSEAVRNLTHPQFRILIALTLRCVELHSHRIAYMSLNQLHSSIAPECGDVNIATFRASLRALQAAGFVQLTCDGGMNIVEVCGVCESHPQIKWSERPGMAVGQSGVRCPVSGGSCRNPKEGASTVGCGPMCPPVNPGRTRLGSAIQDPAASGPDCQAKAVTYPGKAKTSVPCKPADENPLSADEDSLFEDGFSLSEGETSLAEDEKSLTPLDVTPDGNSTCDFSAETLSSERTERDESIRAEATGDPSPVRRLSSVVCRSEPKAVGHQPALSEHRESKGTQDAGLISAAEGSTEGSALIHTSKSCCQEAPAGLAGDPSFAAPTEGCTRPETGRVVALNAILQPLVTRRVIQELPSSSARTSSQQPPDASREREDPFSRSLAAALDALLSEDLERGGVYTVLSTLYGKGLTGKEALQAMRLDEARLCGAMIASGRHRADKPPIAAFRYYAFGSVPPPDWAMAEYASLQRRQLAMADR